MLYVEELIGPDTVNTMPEETIRAFQDHGRVAPTLEQGIDEARRVFEDLAAAGIDYDDVTETLEREGVEKFADSFAALLDGDPRLDRRSRKPRERLRQFARRTRHDRGRPRTRSPWGWPCGAYRSRARSRSSAPRATSRSAS